MFQLMTLMTGVQFEKEGRRVYHVEIHTQTLHGTGIGLLPH